MSRAEATASGGDDPELLERIALALEQLDRGAEIDLATLCADRPDLVPQVEEALGISQRVEALRSKETGTDDLVGETLADRYLILARLGAGAMGVAYRGIDRELRRPVAVKVLRQTVHRPDEATQRFGREAVALASVNDPGIVTIHDRGQTQDGRPFLVMELIDGAPLEDLIEGPRPTRDSVELVCDLARSLSAAHSAGVFHRDLKPSNVMVRSDGPPVLIDFGIAALDDHTTLASGDRGPGTPAYMPPEQLRPGTPPTPAADVYGLTATLYHLLTGRPPYEGSPSQIVARIPHHAPPTAVRLRPDLPRELQAILDKGLARDPRDRYASALAFAEDLQAFLEFRPTTARYVGPLRRRARALLRSAAFRGATGMALATLAVYAALAWQRGDAARRETAWKDNWRFVEPMLGLGNHGRKIEDPARAERLQARLDRAVELAVFPVVSRTVRGLFTFDQGRRSTAAADFEVVAEVEGTPAAAELARRYRQRAIGDDPRPPDLHELPAPRSVREAWLVATHLFRADDLAAAEATLQPFEDQEHPASDLLSLQIRCIGAQRLRGAARLERGRSLHAEALRLETLTGLRTAETAHVLAQTLLLQGRYAEALSCTDEGLALAPDAFPLLNNSILCARRLGDLERALHDSERAMTLRPLAANPYRTRIATLFELDLYGDPTALPKIVELLGRAPLSETERSRFQALLHFNTALERIGAGDLAAARTEIEHAVPIWTEVGVDDEFDLSVAGGILDGNPPFLEQMQLLARDPAHWGHILMVHDWMPESLDTEQTQALRHWLQTLAQHLAPEIEILRGSNSTPQTK